MRPEGWENPDPCVNCTSISRDVNCKSYCVGYNRYIYKEAGADAMYNALWKMAEESPTKTFTLDANVINVFKGG